MTTKKTGTELAVLNAALPMLAGSQPLVQVSSPDSALPKLKIVYGIEVDPAKGIRPEHTFAFGVSSGEGFQPLPADIVMTVIAGRDACRQLVVEVEGVEVPMDKNNPKHKALQASYKTYYKALNEFNKTDEQFKDGLKNGFTPGSVYLVAVILPKNLGVLIAELPAFKTSASYWHKPLVQAGLIPNMMGVKILIDNHSCNLRGTKADPTMKYCDPGKFKQWEAVTITTAQASQIAEAIENAKADVEAWFDR